MKEPFRKVLRLFAQEKPSKACWVLIKKSSGFLLNFFRKVYPIFDPLILFALKRFYLRELAKPAMSGMQLFLVTREDFGTYLNSLHYVGCWREQRGPICAVILGGNLKLIRKIAETLAPNASLICPEFFWLKAVIFLFGSSLVHRSTFAQIYTHLAMANPSSLFIYEQPILVVFPAYHSGKSRYVKFLDPDLLNFQGKVSDPFLEAYVDVRRILDYRLEVYVDYIQLCKLRRPSLLKGRSSHVRDLLGIKGEYVVINVNCKNYYSSELLNRKQTIDPERYNPLIDRLIQEGFAVVLQGREEQPKLRPRKGLYDYAHSAHCSIENDFALYADASFAISSKSGPENFSTVCNIPLLGLEYVELCSMTPNPRARFYPKQIRRRASGRIVSWEELLASPTFFDIGPNCYDSEIEYLSLDSDEMVEALEEFLPLATNSKADWTSYTPLQQSFKNKVHALHLDLFYVDSVPCDAYLRRASHVEAKEEACARH